MGDMADEHFDRVGFIPYGLKRKHKCKEDKTCACSITALEPNENCPVHGNPYPLRCSCGKFVKPAPQKRLEE